jgi:hypothetical protein
MSATILVEAIPDDAVLPPGIYSAKAEDPAYGGLEAMVDERRARYIGERYEVDGSKWIAVEVLGNGMSPNVAETLQWGIDENYYSSALKTYQDWEEKWWREAIQNSVDAGASRVDCLVEPVPEGFAVSCTDDGRGMTIEIMDKFLKLGGTSKGGGGSTGGFGKAKELLVLPWIAWSVHSLGKRMVGQGTTPPTRDDAPFRQGTELRVIMAPDQTTHDSCAMAYIEKCNLPGVRLTVNGKRVRAELEQGEEIRQFAGGKAILYHEKGKAPGRLLVRTGGLFMFEIRIRSEAVKGTLILELKRASTELLTDNRDSFRDWSLKDEVDKFVNSLSADVRSALKKKQGIVREKFNGTGKFRGAPERELRADVLKHLEEIKPAGKTARGPALSDAQQDLIKQIIDARGGGESGEGPTPPEPAHARERPAFGGPSEGPGGQRALFGERRESEEPSGEEVVEREWGRAVTYVPVAPGTPGAVPVPPEAHVGLNLRATGELVTAMLSETVMPGATAVEAAVKQLSWEPDFLLVNTVAGHHVPKMFWPEGMTPSMRKLARFWAELCRFVLIQVGSAEPYGVGFIFDHDLMAAYQKDSRTNEHWLLLNPYRDPSAIPRERGKKPGKEDLYGLTTEDDLHLLYSLAIHEVTHMADGIHYSWCDPEDEGILKEMHDEAFASAMTRNVARCAGKDRQVKAILKAVKVREPKPAGAEPRPKRERKESGMPPLADPDKERRRRETAERRMNRFVLFIGDDDWPESSAPELDDLKGIAERGYSSSKEIRDRDQGGAAVWRSDFTLSLAQKRGRGSALPELADEELRTTRQQSALGLEPENRYVAFRNVNGWIYTYSGDLQSLKQELEAHTAESPGSSYEIRDQRTGAPIWRNSDFDLALAHTPNRTFEESGLSPEDVDPDELLIGTSHELEHTDDPDEAERIALDHLAEDPHYYSRLAACGIDGELVANADLYLEGPLGQGAPWTLHYGGEQAVLSEFAAVALAARYDVPIGPTGRPGGIKHSPLGLHDSVYEEPIRISKKAQRLLAAAGIEFASNQFEDEDDGRHSWKPGARRHSR